MYSNTWTTGLFQSVGNHEKHKKRKKESLLVPKNDCSKHHYLQHHPLAANNDHPSKRHKVDDRHEPIRPISSHTERTDKSFSLSVNPQNMLHVLVTKQWMERWEHQQPGHLLEREFYFEGIILTPEQFVSLSYYFPVNQCDLVKHRQHHREINGKYENLLRKTHNILNEWVLLVVEKPSSSLSSLLENSSFLSDLTSRGDINNQVDYLLQSKISEFIFPRYPIRSLWNINTDYRRMNLMRGQFSYYTAKEEREFWKIADHVRPLSNMISLLSKITSNTSSHSLNHASHPRGSNDDDDDDLVEKCFLPVSSSSPSSSTPVIPPFPLCLYYKKKHKSKYRCGGKKLS